MVKKLGKIAFWVFLVYFIAYRPIAASGVFKHLFSKALEGAGGIGTFLSIIFT